MLLGIGVMSRSARWQLRTRRAVSGGRTYRMAAAPALKAGRAAVDNMARGME